MNHYKVWWSESYCTTIWAESFDDAAQTAVLLWAQQGEARRVVRVSRM